MILKYLIILFFLTWMAWLDIRYRRVPNEIIVALLLTSVPLSVTENDFVLRSSTALILLLVFIIVFDKISASVGGADIKIIIVSLVLLHLNNFIVVLLITQVLMLGYTIRCRNLKVKVPFFTFLWVGMIIMITLYLYGINANGLT
jgi:Flp pilus assembly protein protease CpaA